MGPKGSFFFTMVLIHTMILFKGQLGVALTVGPHGIYRAIGILGDNNP